ncbi:MAG: hypothetical protein ACXAC7_01705 [Candidatus Hodarchaeales archaeon]
MNSPSISSTLGLDAGGTFIKLGNPLEQLESYPLPFTRSFIKKQIEKKTSILLTGAGSQLIKKWFPDQNIKIIPELKATGLGGSYLAGYNECIVVNVGSGTPILYTNRKESEMKVVHLGGTGMGSATIVGLSHYLTNENNLEKIGKAALKGEPGKVNLLVGDLYSNPAEIGLPAHITASNFGKYQNWRHVTISSNESKPSKDDLLAGLHSMVSETIAVISTLASRQFTKKKLPVVITGGGTLNPGLVKYLKSTFEYLKQKFVFPEKAIFGTLYGCFIEQDLI